MLKLVYESVMNAYNDDGMRFVFRRHGESSTSGDATQRERERGKELHDPVLTWDSR